jgi:hypothetical protein
MDDHVKERAGSTRGEPRSRGRDRRPHREQARREEGRTVNKSTQSTGNPTISYEGWTRSERYTIAKEKDVVGRSRMGKQG